MLKPVTWMCLIAASAFATNDLPAFGSEGDGGVITQHVEAVPTPLDVIEAIEASHRAAAENKSEMESASRPPALDPIPFAPDPGGLVFNAVVNLGKLVWDIIAANAPVANITTDYATALPRGVTSAGDLDGFSPLQYHSYHLYGTNIFGGTAYDVTYTLVHQYGGTYNGRGQYLASVGIVPSQVHVTFGYGVDMKVVIIGVSNTGSADEAVGAVNLSMAFRVHTLFKDDTTTTVYEFRGDSAAAQAPHTP